MYGSVSVMSWLSIACQVSLFLLGDSLYHIGSDFCGSATTNASNSPTVEIHLVCLCGNLVLSSDRTMHRWEAHSNEAVQS